MTHSIAIPAEPGEVRWSPIKTLWWCLPVLGSMAWAPQTAGLDTVALLVVGLGVTVGLGHVVGFHRGLVHRSYRTSRPLEYVLVWLGSLAGITGPLELFRQHELRDHWQNQVRAPAVLSYDHGLLRDFWWYLHCTWTPHPQSPFVHSPHIPPKVAEDRFYRWLNRNWRWQQLALAVVLALVGGWSWVVWGSLVRLALTTTLFWLVNYLCHTWGTVDEPIADTGEEGRNTWVFALFSFGEAWHNNHHAWPNSAQVGVRWYEVDVGYRIIQVLEGLGLVWDVKTIYTSARRPLPEAAH